MVRGCAKWLEQGLAEPDKVRGATEAYREEQDRIGQFVAEQCQYGAQMSIEQSDLYRKYSNWAFLNGYRPMGSGKFRKQLLKVTRGKVTAGRTTIGKRKNIATYQGMGGTDGGALDVRRQ